MEGARRRTDVQTAAERIAAAIDRSSERSRAFNSQCADGDAWLNKARLWNAGRASLTA